MHMEKFFYHTHYKVLFILAILYISLYIDGNNTSHVVYGIFMDFFFREVILIIDIAEAIFLMLNV